VTLAREAEWKAREGQNDVIGWGKRDGLVNALEGVWPGVPMDAVWSSHDDGDPT
jgi:hypothetical protein